MLYEGRFLSVFVPTHNWRALEIATMCAGPLSNPIATTPRQIQYAGLGAAY